MVVALIVTAVFFFVYKLFLFATFDAEVAQFYGVPTGWVDTLFSLMLAATIVVSMQVLGVTMIAAAIVIPPIVARLLTNSFRRMTLLSTAIGIICAVLGIYASYFVDVSSGASVVLLSAALFVWQPGPGPRPGPAWDAPEGWNNSPRDQVPPWNNRSAPPRSRLCSQTM